MGELLGRRWRTLPRLIVFDVDYTLWPYWCDCHTRPPYAKRDDGKIVDGSGQEIVLYDDVPSIVAELSASPSVQIALASRTGEPSWLQQIAKLCTIAPAAGTAAAAAATAAAAAAAAVAPSLWELADFREIYPGDKKKHFRQLVEKSGVPASQMLFFDDEQRNDNVCSMGVTFVNAEGGLSKRMMIEGLEQYAASHEESGGEES